MRKLLITVLILSALLSIIVVPQAAQEKPQVVTLVQEFPCQVTVNPIDLREGTITGTATYYSRPKCQGTLKRRANFAYPNPNQAALNAKLAAMQRRDPKFDPTFARGFTQSAPKTEFVKCQGNQLLDWVPNPGKQSKDPRLAPAGENFDVYSGGHYACRDPAANENRIPNAAGGPSVYRCGSAFVEGAKCTIVAVLAALVPGVREFVAVIFAGNVEAAILIAYAIGMETVAQAVSLIPGIDSCVCVATDAFSNGRCSLNLQEFLNYIADEVASRVGQGHARSFCSYHTP